MTFTETIIPGAYLVHGDVFADERGVFELAWMPDEFRARGLETHVAQASLASNHARGTIRGLHFQHPPFAQAKLVRVVRGSVFDVALDLRPDSPAFRRWVGVELSAANHRMLYIPPGCAHGYQTLCDDAALFYFVSAPYAPAAEAGVRWDDPAFGIEWPLGTPSAINARDASYPDFAGSTAR